MMAIGKLIKKIIGDDKAMKRELAMAIAPEGTKTTEKALRRLAELMKFGERLDFYEERLRPILGVEDSLFDDAVWDTREQLRLDVQQATVEQEARRRREFRPHIFMVGEQKVPSSITMCALSGGNRHRMIFLDDEEFQNQSVEEQMESIRGFIKVHQEEKGGMVMFFGSALAYLYRPTASGNGIQFTTQGQIVKTDVDIPSYMGRCIIRVG